MTLLPSNHISQLLIKNNQKVTGTIDITINKLSTQCAKSSSFFSRSADILVQSRKLCPKQGSCTGDTCANVALDTKIPELEASNNLPGNSYCADSCSFLLCKCGLPTTSCIFFRPHAVPKNKKAYEIFTCPTWSYSANLTVKIVNAMGETKQHHILLTTGIPISLQNGLKLSITSVTQAPAPILGTQFITDGKRVAIANEISTPVHCNSISEAETFKNCKLRADACSCLITDPTVACTCKNADLETYFLPEKILPIFGQLFLKNYGKRIFATLPHASMQLQISLRDFVLSASYSAAICKFTPISVEGCYNCLTGAAITYKCDAHPGSAMAKISCANTENEPPEIQFSTFCDGSIQKTFITASQKKLHLMCEITCPAGMTKTKLKGDLAYIPQSRWIRFKSEHGDLDNRLDLFSIFAFFALPQLAILLATITISIFAILLFVRLNPIFKLYRAVARILFTIFVISFVFPHINGMSDVPDAIFSDFVEFVNNNMHRPVSATELRDWWHAKSARKTEPSRRQEDPRKYEFEAEKKFETRKELERSKKRPFIGLSESVQTGLGIRPLHPKHFSQSNIWIFHQNRHPSMHRSVKTPGMSAHHYNKNRV